MSVITCRICLASDVRMHSIINSPLQQIYERLTNVPFQTEDCRPKTVCYICHHQLKKCQKFILKSSTSEELFTQLISKGELNRSTLDIIQKQSCHISWCLNVSPIEYISSLESEVKDEANIKVEEVKIEQDEFDHSELRDEDNTTPLLDLPDHDSSDSEDDIPLRDISTRNDVSIEKKPRAKVKKKEGIRSRKPRKGIIPDAKEVTLSKQEQLDQLLERSKSHNYLNSPFKCELCYKGFVDANAFQNHKEKHDERSGQFECDICHLKYQSVRLMRAHIVSSHSRYYLCNKCGHRSHTANQARDHERWHNGYTYDCQLCGQNFRKPTSYLTHMRKSHPTEHICSICGESFVSKHGLTMHKRKMHRRENESDGDKSKTHCPECNICFVSIDAWAKHVLTSLKHSLSTGPSACLICSAEVPSKSLKTHLKEHSDVLQTVKTYKQPKLNSTKVSCRLCGVDFVSPSKMQAHIMRIHLGKKHDKNIVCEVCGKKCISIASLKYHQRTHTGEKPYPCAQCPKRFVDSNQLRIHGRIHSGHRPYTCIACGKTFTQKPALNRHCRIHTGVRPYDCQYCSKTFTQSNSLKNHVNTVHLKLPPKKKQIATKDTDKIALAPQNSDA